MMPTIQRRRLWTRLVAGMLPPLLFLTVLLVYIAALTPEQWMAQRRYVSLAGGVLLTGYAAFAMAWVKKLVARVTSVANASSLLAEGKLDYDQHINGRDEITAIADALGTTRSELKNKTWFADQLRSGNLQATYTPLGDSDQLGHSLLRIKENLLAVKEDDRRRTWANDGLARFVEVLRSDKDLKDLCHDIIKNLVNLLHANQGAIFIAAENAEGELVLDMQACYAFDRKKFLNKSIAPGEGIIGQAYLEKETVYLKEIPDNFVRITSGLGEANPRFLLITPLKMNETVVGVIEMASFKPFEKHEITFVEKIGETIAHNIISFQTADRTRRLLQESQEQTEHMRAQEEELRQNQEELQATQEEISRKYQELFRQLTQLNYDARFDQLRSINSTKRHNVEYYFDIIRNQIVTFAENTMVAEAMQVFAKTFYTVADGITPAQASEMEHHVRHYYATEFIPRLQENVHHDENIEDFLPPDQLATAMQYRFIASNPHPTGHKQLLDNAGDRTDYSRAHATYHPIMRSFLEKFGYYDIFLVDHVTGRIVYSVFKEVDFGTSLTDGRYSHTNFGRVVQETIASTDRNFVKLVDFEPYAPSYQAPASFIACPIYAGAVKVGLLVFQMPINKINQILTGDNKWRDDGLGDTGETFLVGHDKKLRSVARELIENKTHYLDILRREGYNENTLHQIDKMNTSILMERVTLEGVAKAAAGDTGTAIERDASGQELLVAYAPISIPDVHWVIVSTMQEEEASMRINALRKGG